MTSAEVFLSVNCTTLIDRLYASLLNKQGFEDFLSCLKHCFNASSVALLVIPREPDSTQWGWTVGVTASFEQWSRENNLVTQNTSINQMEKLGSTVDGFISVGQLLNGAALIDIATDSLKPWLLKEAIIDSAGLIIPLSAQNNLLLALQRSTTAGKFSEDDIQQMNMLAPHIKRAAQLFFQFYPVEAYQPKAENIRNLFNLTPTEALVCEMLVTGLTLKDIARKRDVSVHTVREQMRQVYQKTGYRRQSEVVAAILRT